MSKSASGANTKERGGWLSAWLILIGLQGILYSFLILYLRGQRDDPSPAWILIILFALSLADVVAAVAVWKWKKWGLQLYALSTVIGIAVGLVFTGSQLIVFHDIVPLALLGYLIRGKWSYFDQTAGPRAVVLTTCLAVLGQRLLRDRQAPRKEEKEGKSCHSKNINLEPRSAA